MKFLEFASRAGRWERGRQQTGYEKMLILASKWPIGFDVYLLRYRVGQGIPPHTDPVTELRHFRANWVLKEAMGGCFTCEHCLYKSKRLNIFRSDISIHSVSPVILGTRYVLSVGWVLK